MGVDEVMNNVADAIKYWIFLQYVLGQGSRKILRILDKYETPENFYNAGPEAISKTDLLSKAEFERYTKCKLSDCEKIINYCYNKGYQIITPDDSRYPIRLKRIPNPPAALYVEGEFPNFDDEVAIAMVGTRQCSENGKRIARELSQRLTYSGCMIVSGGAKGIDSSCHIGAIKAEGKTVAVLGCGLDYPYLPQNEALRRDIVKNGCLISEYTPKRAASKYTFPIRNRLISGLCLGTIVVEAIHGSGSLITVDHALEQGRDIFVIPGSISDPLYAGSNRLIRDGARAIVSPEDILEEYKNDYPHRINFFGCEITITDDEDVLNPKDDIKPKPKRKSLLKKSKSVNKEKTEEAIDISKLKLNYEFLSDNAKQLFAAFLDVDTDNFDLAVDSSGLESTQAIVALTELEILGFLTAQPGGRYSANKF